MACAGASGGKDQYEDKTSARRSGQPCTLPSRLHKGRILRVQDQPALPGPLLLPLPQGPTVIVSFDAVRPFYVCLEKRGLERVP